eukprot:6308427-Alexandrium_andersonii.AAC.1
MFLQASAYITVADKFDLPSEQRLTHRAPGATGPPSCDSPGFSEIDFVLVPTRWASSVHSYRVDQVAPLNTDHFPAIFKIGVRLAAPTNNTSAL